MKVDTRKKECIKKEKEDKDKAAKGNMNRNFFALPSVVSWTIHKPPTVSVPFPRPSPPASVSAWVSRVYDIQVSCMGPEERERIRERAEQSRHTMEIRATSRAVRHTQRTAATSVTHGYREIQASASPAMSSVTAQRQLAVLSERVDAYMPMSLMPTPARTADAPDEPPSRPFMPFEAEYLEERNHEVEAAQDAEAETDFNDILEKLREEPSSDEDAEAKFQLYETYAITLQKVREKLQVLWETSKPKFTGSSLQHMERSIKKIDDTQRMRIGEGNAWFGYYMMKQAISNNSNMSKLLAEIDTKLGLLDANDPCPICMDSYTEKKQAHVLACCHKVCKECWSNWTTVKPNAFCPLCKHQDFIQELEELNHAPASTGAAAGLER